MPQWQTTEQARHALAEARAERSTLSTEISRLAAVPGELAASERSRWEDVTGRVDALNATIEAAEAFLDERAGRIDRLNGAVSLATGDGAAGIGAARDRMTAWSSMRRVDPEEALSRARSTSDDVERTAAYHEASRASIDHWADRTPIKPERQERADLVVAGMTERDGVERAAEWIVRSSTPEYREAWMAYMAGGPGNVPSDLSRMAREANALLHDRAMSEASGAVGQFAVPAYLDPSIVLSNQGVASPFREISTIHTIATQTWRGITSQGVTAEWTAEASEMTDASPTLASPSISPVRADAVLQLSWELLADTQLVNELGGLFSDARDRLEGGSTGFALGSGSTQPTGLITTLSVTTASKVNSTTNAAFGAPDAFALDNNLSQRWRKNASWMANRAILNQARQFATGTGALAGSFWVDFGPDHPSTLLGYAVRESSAMQSSLSTATASTDYVLVLGDFSQYVIVDRLGLSVLLNAVVLGSNRRPTGESQYVGWWRTSGLAINTDAFRLLVC
jgi:HK97 family phage major capsid protein